MAILSHDTDKNNGTDAIFGNADDSLILTPGAKNGSVEYEDAM